MSDSSQFVFVTVCKVRRNWGFVSRVWVRDREGDQFYLPINTGHPKRDPDIDGLKVKLDDSQNPVFSEEPEFKSPSTGDRLFLELVDNGWGLVIVRWGYAPQSHTDDSLYCNPWCDSLDLQSYVGGQVRIESGSVHHFHEQVGELATVSLNDKVMTLVFRWRVDRWNRYNWEPTREWTARIDLRNSSPCQLPSDTSEDFSFRTCPPGSSELTVTLRKGTFRLQLERLWALTARNPDL